MVQRDFSNLEGARGMKAGNDGLNVNDILGPHNPEILKRLALQGAIHHSSTC